MSNSYLKLEINSFSVRLEQFLNETLPRLDAEGQGDTVLYTAGGSTVIQGGSFEVFSLWNVEAQCTKTDFDTLKLIQRESKYQRQNSGSPNILITDTTQRFRERGSRTRALAPSTSETSQSPYVLYFAQFYGIISSPIEGRISGKGYIAKFTISETDKTAP